MTAHRHLDCDCIVQNNLTVMDVSVKIISPYGSHTIREAGDRESRMRFVGRLAVIKERRMSEVDLRERVLAGMTCPARCPLMGRHK